ncbi:AAA family ATPase [Sinomonas atrocyanea]
MDLPHQAVASAVFGVPRVPRSAVRRPRLERRIDELLAVSDAVVLRGPAGAGKTVALADWAAAAGPRGTVAWITLDQQHAGRTQFWREVVYGLAGRLAATAGNLLERCLAALDAGVDPRAVVARFAPLIPPTTVVVDSADLISGELFEDIVWAIQHNRHVQGVFASRRRTPWSRLSRR